MKHFALIAVVLIGLSAAASAASLSPYVDFWTNAAYRTTNGEKTNFNSLLVRSQGIFGLNFTDLLPGIKLVPYVAYYGVGASSDPNYWNNNVAAGAGLRVLPFTMISFESWSTEWLRDVKFFYETLSLSYLKDETTAAANNAKKTDTRFGIDLWHEWNLTEPNPALPWNEMWLNLSYRDTDFATFNYYRTYLLFLQNKFGLFAAGGLRPYLSLELTASGRAEEWYNSLYYGLGIRVEPFRETPDPPEILKKFKMFIEVLGISWLKGSSANRPTQDVRFGVDFTFGR